MKKKMTALIFVLTLLMANSVTALAGTWVEEDNRWKYYSDNGVTVTGWVYDNDHWYYMDASGTMKTGWIKVDGSWYYCYEDGSMAADTWIDNYYVNPSGKWTKTR